MRRLRRRARRLAVVLQMTSVDCGLACLVMVLRHYGAEATLSGCHQRARLGRDGTTLRVLAAVARSYGLVVRAYHTEPEGLLRLPLPAIAHWEAAHYVVIEAATARRVTIIDPAIGRRSLTWEELKGGLTGAVLTFAASAEFRRAPRRRFRRLREIGANLAPLAEPLSRARGTLAKMAAASVTIQLLAVLPPILTAIVLDNVLPEGRRDLLVIVGAGGAALVVAHLVASTLRTSLLIRLQANLDSQLSGRVFAHLLALPFGFFQQRPGGDLMQRMTSTTLLRELVTSQALTAVLDGALMLVYLAILLIADVALGAIVLLIGAVELVLLASLQGRSRRLHQQYLRAQAQTQALVYEALDGIATIKASGTEDQILRVWSERYSDSLAVGTRQRLLDAHLQTATTALQVLAPIAVLVVGAQRVVAGSLSLGTMMAIQALSLAFLVPLGSLVTNAHQLQAVGAHLERLRDILDAQGEPRRASTKTALRGDIEVRNVWFEYDGAEAPALRDVSLTVRAGQKVAIVGRSGSGKTTLALLLLGFHRPNRGQILYDGVPGEQLDPQELRRQFGVVLQEPFIFGESVRRNIAATDPDLPLQVVEASARIAAIHDDIAAMPMRYETRLAAGGGGLSGGQRQRVSIARAVAHGPAVLLVDEGTSHLDVVTERRVDANLDGLGCTRIVIAHRLSTVSTADLIVVLEDGAVVEQGGHAELLARDGAYAALVNGQAPEPTRAALPLAPAA
jgi:ABC-type bacteriocin/lantibiotic exporter with double-glycine peptidase domain